MKQEEYQNIPRQYRPLTAWNYFFLQLLYTIPVVGFVFLIIHALFSGNINRRNFARSYFCIVVIVLVLFLILYLAGAITSIAGLFTKSE